MDKEDFVFLKILSNNVDPATGDFAGLSDQTLSKLKCIYEKFQEYEQKLDKEIRNNEMIVNDFRSGLDLSQLKAKYSITKKKIRAILKESGFSHVCDTYYKTIKHINEMNNPDYINVGARYSFEEDLQLIEEYRSGQSISEIAKKHKRRVGGIKARLIYHYFADMIENLHEVWIFSNKEPTTFNIYNKKRIFTEMNINENSFNIFLDNYIKRERKRDKMAVVDRERTKALLLRNRYNLIYVD